MRKLYFLPKVLFVAAFVFAQFSVSFAQSRSLPGGLAMSSSLSDILSWLEENSLKEVRIGLNSHGSGLLEGQIPTAVDTYAESAVFAKGFRFEKLVGCKLTLRNEDFDLISFGRKYPDPRRGSFAEYREGTIDKTSLAHDLLIPLDRIIAKKSPYRHTKNTEASERLGTWRTVYNQKSSFFIFSVR